MMDARAVWAMPDRMPAMLVFACLVHVMLILGVHVDLPKPENKLLEITLVKAPAAVKPKKADVLAEQNQSSPVKQKIEEKPQPVKPKPALNKAEDLTPKQPAVEEKPQLITAETLRQQISELAYKQPSQLSQAMQPRIVYVNSVNAHQYKAAAYEKAWQDKVERIGNLNYPEEARKKKLSGGLLLSVGIKPDGSIYTIQVRRSSGFPELDDAAIRIVRMAAPFAPFPEELKAEADVLVITRSWKFFNDYRMETSP